MDVGKLAKWLWLISGLLVFCAVVSGALFLGLAVRTSTEPAGLPQPAHGTREGGVTPTTATYFCPPLFLPDSPWQIVAILTREFEASSAGGIGSGSSYSSDPDCGKYSRRDAIVRNLLIRNRTSGDERLLFRESVIIAKLRIPQKGRTEDEYCCNTPNNMIYFEVIDSDTNKNGRLDLNDAASVFLSDFSGSNLARITPAESFLNDSTVDPMTGELYFQVYFDRDFDGKFSSGDEVSILRSNPQFPYSVTPVIKKSTIAEIQRLYGPGSR